MQLLQLFLPRSSMLIFQAATTPLHLHDFYSPPPLLLVEC